MIEASRRSLRVDNAGLEQILKKVIEWLHCRKAEQLASVNERRLTPKLI